MSHTEKVIELLKTHSFVPISELRGWCNYRSRISDARPLLLKEDFEVKSVLVNGIHGYQLKKLDFKVDLFKVA